MYEKHIFNVLYINVSKMIRYVLYMHGNPKCVILKSVSNLSSSKQEMSTFLSLSDLVTVNKSCPNPSSKTCPQYKDIIA